MPRSARRPSKRLLRPLRETRPYVAGLLHCLSASYAMLARSKMKCERMGASPTKIKLRGLRKRCVGFAPLQLQPNPPACLHKD